MKLGKMIEQTDPKDRGPKAFCIGTFLPCSAGTACPHYGIHFCSTFKKHTKHPCPYYADRGFICTKVEDETGENDGHKELP